MTLQNNWKEATADLESSLTAVSLLRRIVVQYPVTKISIHSTEITLSVIEFDRRIANCFGIAKNMARSIMDTYSDTTGNIGDICGSTCASSTAKKTNEWVLNKAGVKRELLDTVKARKLAYCGHTIRKQGSCLEKEIMQGTVPGTCRRGRPRTAWLDNINTWTGLPMEESVRTTEAR